MKSPTALPFPLIQTVTRPRYGPPPADVRTEVCVVGAGIAGLTTAYLLAREGKAVVVLDEGPVGAGQTERTSAHLASAIDDRFIEIEKHHGRDGSRLAYESHAAAIDAIERISRDEGIEWDSTPRRVLSRANRSPYCSQGVAAAHRAGFTDALKHERIRLCGYETGPCIRFPRQGRFHPLKYLFGLAAALEKLGGKIYTGCRVKDVRGADPAKREPARAQIDDGPAAVLADAVVVATNTPAPINDWMGIYTNIRTGRTDRVRCAGVGGLPSMRTLRPVPLVRREASQRRRW